MSSKKLIISSFLFFVGITFGLALAIVSVWADYEAARYFFTGAAYDSFRGMECPSLMSRSETGTIYASIQNPTDRDVQPVYKVEMSGPLGQLIREQILIPPHETQRIEWTMNADNIDLGFFIMAKLTVLGFAGIPTREATCGVFVVDFWRLTGAQTLGVTLTISLLGILVGLAIWEKEMETATKGFVQPQRGRRALGLTVLLAMLTGLMGSWTAGILFCVLSVLLLVIILLAALRG
jgi:hypothetical protein